MTYQTLLPANSSQFERTVEQAAVEAFPLPVPNGALWNPDTCPPGMLDWLAYNLSVDLWRATWPVWKKRQACRDAITMARLKGTLAGLRKFVGLADGKITNVVTPPVKMFAGKSYTKADLDLFYSVMPQLRIYPNRNRNRNVFGKMFAGNGCGPGRFALASVARTGRRAYLFDPLDNSLRDLTTAQLEPLTETGAAVEITRMVTAGIPGNAFFAGYCAGRHVGKIEKASVVRTVSIERSYIHEESRLRLSTIEPSLTPVDVRSERGTEVWRGRPGKFYAGRSAGFFAAPSDAWLHVFSMVRLHDPARSPALRRGARWFAGARLGIKAHTAEIRIKVDIQHRKHTFFAGRYVGSVFARPVDTRVRDIALEAVHSAKSAHEKILVSFQNHKEPTFGDAIKLDGTLTFGSLIPRR